MVNLEDSAKKDCEIVQLNRREFLRVKKGPAIIYKPVGIDVSKDIDYYL